MRLTKCEKRHFYDADKYPTCPHCRQLAANAAKESPEVPVTPPTNRNTPQPAAVPKELQKTESFFAEGKEKAAPAQNVPVSSPAHPQPAVAKEPKKVEAPAPEVQRNEQAPVPQNSPHPAVVQEPRNAEPSTPEVPPKAAAAEKPAGHIPAAAVVGEGQPRSTQPLSDSVNAVRETVRYEDAKTVAFYDNDTEPVVGWLVCVKGESFGVGFPLKTGNNTIGRSARMDVALTKDMSISRDRHAIVIYEPLKRHFFIQPGESKGLTYVNDELLLVPQRIHDFDTVQMGNVKFVFRTLCGDGFSWDSYMAGEN